jgi:hypothetical protein
MSIERLESEWQRLETLITAAAEEKQIPAGMWAFYRSVFIAGAHAMYDELVDRVKRAGVAVDMVREVHALGEQIRAEVTDVRKDIQQRRQEKPYTSPERRQKRK